jgi:hypothetical protein
VLPQGVPGVEQSLLLDASLLNSQAAQAIRRTSPFVDLDKMARPNIQWQI